MTRVEDLTLKLLDGTLTDPESAELRSLLDQNSEALRVHLMLLDIEADLRGGRENLDLGVGVVDRIEQLRDRRIERGVMDRIQALPPSRPRRTVRRDARTRPGYGSAAWRIAGVAAVLMMVILYAVLSGRRAESTPRRIAVKPVPAPEVPRVAPTPAPEPTVVPKPAPPALIPAPLTPPPAPPPDPGPVAPTPSPKPVETTPPHVPAPTVVAIGELESVSGEVRLLGPGGPVAARAGQSAAAGQGIETGGTGQAVFKFLDGTRVRLMENGAIRSLDAAKRIVLSEGVLHAEVVRQPAGRSATFVTPQGEAKVLGTRLTIHVRPTWSRLEVQEGKVRLSTPVAPAGIEVAAGHFGLAAPGIKLIARPLPNSGAVAGFSIFNLDNGLPVAGFDPIPDNAVLNFATLPRNLNIRALTAPGAVGSVRFELDALPKGRVENSAPYELSSEAGLNPFPWPPAPGVHVLSGTAFSGPNGTGSAGGAYTLSFRVVDR